MDIEVLRTINSIVTPLSLLFSTLVVAYGIRGFRRHKTGEKRAVALALLGVGVVFFINGFLLTVAMLEFMKTSGISGHVLANFRILLVNVFIILTSSIMIGIYRNKL